MVISCKTFGQMEFVSYLKNVGSDTDKAVEQLRTKVDSVGGGLGENIDEVVGGLRNGVRSLLPYKR